MKKLTPLFLLLTILIESQVVSLNLFKKSDGSDPFKNAMNYIRKNYTDKNIHAILFIPSGNYKLNEPIILDKYISIEGEFENTTILQVMNSNQEAIILDDNKKDEDVFNTYTTIKNLTIIGPEVNKNPFEWKDLSKNNPKSVGIKILGLRTKIQNCTIDGFLSSGIEISASYYNFIANNFIKNNRVGIIIDNTSTSTYINNNEIRTNAIAILIQNNSYANFINNNMIESNIGNLLHASTGDKDKTVLRKGGGIVISNAMNNFIKNNYFEQQFNNIFLSNANDNDITSNFFALGDVGNITQNIVKLMGKSDRNKIIQNQTMGSNTTIDVTKIYLSPDGEYSSNTIDFGNEKNKVIKNKIRTSKIMENSPQIP